MIYKNTKTGAVINSPCIIRGGDWVVVEPEPKPKEPPKKEAPKKRR